MRAHERRRPQTQKARKVAAAVAATVAAAVAAAGASAAAVVVAAEAAAEAAVVAAVAGAAAADVVDLARSQHCWKQQHPKQLLPTVGNMVVSLFGST